MKNVTIRVSEDLINDAEKIFGAKVTGFQEAVAAYFEIRKRTVKEVEHIFEQNEKNAILDNMNGIMSQPMFQARPDLFWAHLEDGDIYEGLFSKWGIDSEALKQKVLALTSAQCYVVQECAVLFWNKDKTQIKDLSENWII